ncbi:MAG TPA: Trm112 family protein [Acidimicrobiia bacterium]|nr:Trm112 family protein [Acidimicrobiia bacterium]
MALDPKLLEILACPDDKGPLFYFEADGFLFCPECRRRYEVRDDIPVMLIDEAETLDEAAAAGVVARAASEGISPTFDPAA